MCCELLDSKREQQGGILQLRKFFHVVLSPDLNVDHQKPNQIAHKHN